MPGLMEGGQPGQGLGLMEGVQPQPATGQAEALMYLPPWVLDYLASLYGDDIYGMTAEMQNERLLYQFDQNLAWLQEQAQIQYQQATEVARIYAGAQTADARARVEAAQIAANAAIAAANIAAEVQRMDIRARIQIAEMTLTVERERIYAQELNYPGGWVGAVGFFQGQTPEESRALSQAYGGTTYGGQPPPPIGSEKGVQGIGGYDLFGQPLGGQGIQEIPRPEMGLEYAMVGEQGPELLEVTPEQIEVLPVKGYAEGGEFDWPDWGGGGRGGWGPGGGGGGGYQPSGGPGGWGSGGGWGPSPPEPYEPPPPPEPTPPIPWLPSGGDGYVPAFSEWTGPTTIPGTNQDIRPPAEWNLEEFVAMPLAVQEFIAGAWRSLHMIAGENPAEIMAQAYDAIRRSAWMGMTGPLVAYGGWGRA